ncbi:hypothetical protein GGI19_004947 [Coemansia pectinata]|uniref:Zn(2)-C6 fungal-type domain-containing protein n=1 Tax=Coemansia pectinata TaxID=1052879 RepID=A0A9W8L9T3_9FUNG|nr:hypothetical protein GGI19_004947 [Coemansia pectinata]
MDFFFLPSSTNDNSGSRQPSLAEIASEAAAQLAAMSQQPSDPQGSMPLPAKPAGNKPIGMACRACRLRKIRCGGERPRCTYCIKKGYECVLTPHKKRGRPRKNPQTALSDEEKAVEQPDLDVRQLWAELTGLQGLEFPSELSALAGDLAAQESNIPYIGPNFNLGVNVSGSLAPMSTSDPLLFASSNYAFPLFDPLVPSSATQPLFSFMPMDMASAASHEQVGQQVPRTDSAGMESPGSAVSSVQQREASAVSTQNSVPTVMTIDEGVRQYFVYVHPWMPILHRPTFERQITDGTVDPLLYYCVQAIAARFTDSNNSRKPYKRGQRFARAARRLLPQSLKSASLSTLQAVTLLALYMSVSGQWQAGAAFEKLAVQLAFVGQYHLLDEEFLLPPVTNNLGLFESGWSEHSHPARLEVLSRPGGILEHEQRRRAWWSVFQLERFNGLAMGRPPIIKPGWHWVWLPCSEELWARENPSGTLAWEMGLADSEKRPPSAVSSSRVDLVLALIMGQIIEQRTDMFRLFFPRVDKGTLFHDNLPTHEMDWAQRLRKLVDAVGSLEKRIRQWHNELDRYADQFSARRHANLEIMGASCQIHLHACVLQIREHLFEDLIGDDTIEVLPSGAQTPIGGSDSDRSSSLDFSAMFERHTGTPFDRATYQRGYMARAKRPPLSLEFVEDLDVVAQRCWDRSVAMSDEVARLLRVHWLRALENSDLGMFTEDVTGELLDPLVADRFKLMNPQTPYHLFVAGKVQAARLKQAVTARAQRTQVVDDESPVGVAIRRINDIWDKHAVGADVAAIESRLDDIIKALEYCQLFWYSLNFASHLKYLKKEAAKPLLQSVYRE